MEGFIKILSNRKLAWLWSATILFLCVIPSDNIPTNDTLTDKVAHLGVFIIWAVLWNFSYGNYLKVLLIGISFGCLIEFIQYLLPKSFHRGFELLDIVADAIGIIIGLNIPIFIEITFVDKCRKNIEESATLKVALFYFL